MSKMWYVDSREERLDFIGKGMATFLHLEVAGVNMAMPVSTTMSGSGNYVQVAGQINTYFHLNKIKNFAFVVGADSTITVHIYI